jgi:ATP-dependent protease HslVU (ClpYQ) peptidase subunit
MNLEEAKEVAALVLESSNIVIVTSNKAIFHLDNVSEIANVEEYAKSNKLEMFVVKNEVSEEVSEDKPKKKK